MTACQSATPAAKPVVETASGKVKGKPSGGATAFLGIPYAQAGRFQKPQAVEPWAGTRDCTSFGPNAPQSNPNPPSGPSPIILAHLPRPEGAPPPSRAKESEDCQVLNVWTASTDVSAKRPVMVWLHGGFFSSSSGSTVDGTALAEKHGVVVVSLNHRLNTFGFTDLSAYGSEFADSANAGMQDIVAALNWMRENIAAFGGDPERIMVFGTSGGGMKTSILMASPLARGLLHRAGVQSGPGLRFLTRDEAAVASERLLAEFGLTAASASDLMTMPVERLLGACHAVSATMRPARFQDIPCFGPVVDGNLLERQPFAPNAAPCSGDIPLIIGSNTDEMTFFMGNDQEGFALDEAGFDSRVRDLAPHAAEKLAAHYRQAFPENSPSQLWIRLFSDYSIALPVQRQAERHAAVSGGKTWLYQLALDATVMDGKLGSTHTLETPLIFDTADGSPLLVGSARAQDVADAMSQAWCGLAADGTPGLDAWDAFTGDNGGMLFDADTRYISDIEAGNLALLAEVFPDT